MPTTSSKTTTLMLDFDGVLNNEPFLRQQKNDGGQRLFDPENIENLNVLCTSIEIAGIVITSSWRENRTIEQLRTLLHDEGFAYPSLVLGATGPASGIGPAGRATEISAWLELAHPPRGPIVIVDDYDLSSYKLTGADVFKVDPWLGLTNQLVTQIIEQLQNHR